jgi:hypothetical protein
MDHLSSIARRGASRPYPIAQRPRSPTALPATVPRKLLYGAVLLRRSIVIPDNMAALLADFYKQAKEYDIRRGPVCRNN